MKINDLSKLNKINKSDNCLKNQVLEEVKNISAENINCSSNICKCSFGQAQVNMQNSDETDIINSIIDSDCKIKRVHLAKKENIKYFQIGKPIDGFNNLLETVANVTCYYDENNNLKRIFLQDEKTLETKIYNSSGNLEKIYSSEDMQALKYYKYHPDSIHKFLRNGKQLYSGDWAKETENCIDKLKEIFENNTFETDKTMKLYRGMHIDIDKIGNIGEIYEDSSFVSTSTDIDIAKRFAGENPIMEITFPKGSKYIDMDLLFNINGKHWSENEYLVNCNSKFLITNYDKEANIIKAEYISQ